MAGKPKEQPAPKRLNRTVGLADALKGALDPALRKRGFASRDLITHWAAMAPAPYDKSAAPDRLVWPRGERGHEGATLYLRCARGHALALTHEGPQVASAINRYFGYLLVASVRLSAEPFTAPVVPARPPSATDPATEARVGEAISGVEEPALRDALRLLGEKLLRPRKD